jgi:hypothetical protein
MRGGVLLSLLLTLPLLVAEAQSQTPSPPSRSQNPSPMVEHTRAHERVSERVLPGASLIVEGVLPGPVRVFVPEGPGRNSPYRLLLHFHGARHVAEHAVAEAADDLVLALVHLGAGSGVYERAFSDPAAFGRLLEAIRQRLEGELGLGGVASVRLSAFSAGYGAIRAILRHPPHFASIDAVLLLDGLHTAYDPPRTVVAEGGSLDTEALGPFVRFAEAAARGEKRFLITHSEIFPGTFASTTEATDHLIHALGLKRTAVLEWGPVGMQQLSTVERGGLRILGFAGNSAPDHVDHLHGMSHFLRLLQAM